MVSGRWNGEVLVGSESVALILIYHPFLAQSVDEFTLKQSCNNEKG